MLIRLRGLRLVGAGLLLAAMAGCGARTPPPAPPPTPSKTAPSRSARPTLPAPPGSRPFGLPVDIGPATVVLRALITYRPQPPLPGRAGTPVRAQVAVNAPAGPAPDVAADLRDPTTGLRCVEQPRRHPPAAVPGATAHLTFSFVCPEIVRSQLLVTISVGAASERFYGPVG